MLGFEFRFPANRYHATPWDRQVNEGSVEWPPAPWRILRALVAVWYRKCPESTSEDALRSLVRQLASSYPEYEVPAGTPMHTRHYMPLYKYKKSGRQKTTKVFDAFIHVESNGVLRMVWPAVILDDETRALADALVSRMGYLGRAESWVEGRLMTDGQLDEWEPNSRPYRGDEKLGGERELCRLLAPDDPSHYEAWRANHEEKFRERILAEKRAKGQNPRVTSANERNIDEAIPADFFAALTSDTSALKSAGWNRPPGSRWIRYVRPTFDRGHTNEVRPVDATERPTVARFKVVTNVPPRLTDAITVGDRTRAAMVSTSDGHPVFTGKAPDGSPLQGHRHTHFIPEALGRNGHVTHITMWAPMGFDEEALAALSQGPKVWSNQAPKFEFETVFLGSGTREDFAGRNRRAGHSVALTESKIWVSRTPFVPTRHIKKRSDGTPKIDEETGYVLGGPRHDLHRLLLEAGFPEPTRISADDEAPAGTSLDGKQTRWLDFRTVRPKGGSGRRATHRGFGFRIEFDQPVRGPLCLGYGAHYGLGRFEPAP